MQFAHFETQNYIPPVVVINVDNADELISASDNLNYCKYALVRAIATFAEFDAELRLYALDCVFDNTWTDKLHAEWFEFWDGDPDTICASVIEISVSANYCNQMVKH